MLRKSQKVQEGKSSAVFPFFAPLSLQIQGRGNVGNTQRLWMKINRQRWGTARWAQEGMRYREQKELYEETERTSL